MSVSSADQPTRLAPISAQMRQKRPPPNDSMPHNIQSLRVRIARFFNRVDRKPDQRRADGNIDEKRPAPAERRGDESADKRPKSDGDADDRSPEAERLGSLRALKCVPEHRQRRAELDRRAHALQGSRRIEN